MDKPGLEHEYEKDPRLRAALQQAERRVTTPQAHDETILREAKATAHAVRKRSSMSSGWRMPLYLAASFLLGVAVLPLYRSAFIAADSPSQLTAPAGQILRGSASAAAVPVEQLPAEVWYRYIQELVYAGETQLAARHLQRFVELHPDYVHEP